MVEARHIIFKTNSLLGYKKDIRLTTQQEKQLDMKTLMRNSNLLGLHVDVESEDLKKI